MAVIDAVHVSRISPPAHYPRSAEAAVDERFASGAPEWRAIYQGADLFSQIHQYRRRIAREWVQHLRLPRGASVLEVGSGAGLMAADLARAGFVVHATDSSPAMLRLAGAHLSTIRAASVDLTLTDAHSLPYADGSFTLAVALGVVPWLSSPAQALQEIVRVLEPGGYLLANADNRARLNHLLDPLYSPFLAGPRERTKRALRRVGLPRAPRQKPATMHWPREFDHLVRDAGLERIVGHTFGFGPFTLVGRHVLPERVALALNAGLQQAADYCVPILPSTGAQYLVLARKPER